MKLFVAFLFTLSTLIVKNTFAQEWQSFRSGGNDGVLPIFTSVATDTASNYIFGGTFTGTKFIENNISITSAGNTDCFIAKYDSLNNYAWVRRFGGTSADALNQVLVHTDGTIYITGVFSGSISFGTASLSSTGSQDMFVAKYSKDGVYLWSARVGGTGFDENPTIALDTSGNLLFSCTFANTISVGSTSITSTGNKDALVAKYSPSGTVLWTLKLGGIGIESSAGVKTDFLGNVYCFGQFTSNTATTTMGSITLTSQGVTDGFLTKISATGSVTAAIRIGGINVDGVTAVTADSANNIYVTGNHNYSANLLIGATSVSSSNTTNMFVAKLTNSLLVDWFKLEGSYGYSAAQAITIYDNNKVVFGGVFSDSLKISNQFVESYGSGNAFICAYNTNGNFEWLRTGGSLIYNLSTISKNKILVLGIVNDTAYVGTFRNTSTVAGSRYFWGVIGPRACTSTTLFEQSVHEASCEGSRTRLYVIASTLGNPVYQWRKNGVIVGKNSRNFILNNTNLQDSGLYTCTVINDCGSATFTIAKFTVVPTAICNRNPPFLWVKSGGSVNEEMKNHKVVIDKQGNSYVAGLFRTTANFGNGLSLTSTGGFDLFIAKYNATGVAQWVKKIGSTGTEELNSLAIDANNNLYITGNCNLAGTNLVTTFDQISTNKNQYFLVKFSSNGDVRWLRQATNHTATGGTLCLDNKGNVYTTLSFQNLLQIDTTLLTQSNNRQALVICKYDSLGNVKLVKKIGDPITGNIGSAALAVDSSGKNIFTIGTINGNVRIDSVNFNTSTAKFFFSKFDTDSLRLKFIKVDSNSSNIAIEQFHLSKNNKIYISFYGEGTLVNIFGSQLRFKIHNFKNASGLIQLDTLGNVNWTKAIDGYGDFITAIASDSFNNVFIAGTSAEIIGSNIGGAICKGNMFFGSFTETGDLRFLKSGTKAEPSSIALDSVGNCYMAGTFKYHAYFDNFYVQGSSQQIALNDFFISKIKSSDFINPIVTNITSRQQVVGGIIRIEGNFLQNITSVSIGVTPAIILNVNQYHFDVMIAANTVSGGLSYISGGDRYIPGLTLTIGTTNNPNIQLGNKTTANTLSVGDRFGSAIAMAAYGNIAIVGSPIENSNVGAAYVYELENNIWIEKTRLTGTHPTSNANGKFGTTVAISADGNIVAVGAPGINSNVGAIYIFRKINNTWIQEKLLVPFNNTGAAQMGSSLSMAANGAIIATGGFADQSNNGAVWLYQFKDNDWGIVQTKLQPTSAVGSSQFGSSVQLSADSSTIVVGGLADNSFRGAFWIFKREASGIYNLLNSKMVPTQMVGSAQVGTAIAVDSKGQTIAVSGSRDDNNKGAVWIYSLQTDGSYTQTNKIINVQTTANPQFGNAVAINAQGSVLIVGNNQMTTQAGGAWQYVRNNATWTSIVPILFQGTGSVGAAQQGTSVAINATGSICLSAGIVDNTRGAFWTFYNQNNINLPVTIKSFTAEKHNQYHQITWQVANEVNVKNYTIELSVDGVVYDVIGKTMAVNLEQYSFKHLPIINAKIYYYRLRIEDKDGSIKYSSVKVIKYNDKVDELSIYPNPVKSNLSIKYESRSNGKAVVQIITLDGRAILTKQLVLNNGTNYISIPLDNAIKKGLYIFRLIDSKEQIQKLFNKE
jgi:hypothetical protein